MCEDGRHWFGSFCRKTSTSTCRTCRFVHPCGNGCLHAVTLSGERVCGLSGLCLGNVFVHQFEHPSEAEHSSLNTTLPSGAPKRAEVFGEDDRKSAALFAEERLVREIVRGVFASAPQEEPSPSTTGEGKAARLPLMSALTRVLNARTKPRAMQTARLDDTVRKICVYYRWCCGFARGGRVPRLRIFTVAMLYVMRTGIRQGAVVLVPQCKWCEAMLPPMARLPGSVMQDKQRSLTGCIKFVKISFSDAIEHMGNAATVARSIENHSVMSSSLILGAR